ncbi:unnamed protein product [Sphenostylis stenocarpa]|uniref:Uncharacterized protein n=1 Tax=Sphenostylis stenocarpa TaxID=92480 RepID=A0AA86ST77_9FABA|nr:unnamed protein product [Sphenostylis stenocarpa]
MVNGSNIQKLIGEVVEVYVDNMVVKSKHQVDHPTHLQRLQELIDKLMQVFVSCGRIQEITIFHKSKHSAIFKGD